MHLFYMSQDYKGKYCPSQRLGENRQKEIIVGIKRIIQKSQRARGACTMCNNMKQIPRIFHFPWSARVGVIVIVEIKTQIINFLEFSLSMTFMRFLYSFNTFLDREGGSRKFCENKISMSMFFQLHSRISAHE